MKEQKRKPANNENIKTMLGMSMIVDKKQKGARIIDKIAKRVGLSGNLNP